MGLLHFPLSLTTRREREREKLKEEDDDGDERGREVISGGFLGKRLISYGFEKLGREFRERDMEDRETLEEE